MLHNRPLQNSVAGTAIIIPAHAFVDWVRLSCSRLGLDTSCRLSFCLLHIPFIPLNSVGSQILFLGTVMASTKKAGPAVEARFKHWLVSRLRTSPWPKQDTDSSPTSVEWESNILPVAGEEASEYFLSSNSND